MFNSPVLETAIGLVFLFLGVSLLTTAVQEFLASFTKLRALTLRSGLKAMFVEGKQGLDFYQKIIGHPLIAPSSSFPSYISAQQFSSAVIHALGGAGDIPAGVTALRIAAQNLPDGPARTVVTSFFREGEDNLDKFEQRLQLWFDQSMERVGGFYKRISQGVSFAIGVVIAFAFQINAIGIGWLLWTDEAMRAAVVAAATTAATSCTGPCQAAANDLALFSITPIWVGPIHFGPTWFVGCLITAAAASLGAPFWFDLLQSFVNLRGTGAKPPPAPTP